MAGDVDWWRGAVLYQVYPRSFQDSNGDGIGDLPGITRRLQHIKSLGTDAIWISPFFKSPMADMGYDVSDYRDVDPMFGTLADFDELLGRAHRLGMKVIIDLVLSHSSDQHEWFKESRTDRSNPKADWYVWADPKPDGTAPNNWLSIFGGPAWEWDGTRMQYYMHSFLTSQPDFNFHNPDVQQALLDEARFWLDRGVDGFRLDACNHYFHDAQLRDNPPAPMSAAHDIQQSNPYGFQDHLYDKTQPENIGFLKRFRAVLADYPGTVAVGEVGDGDRSPATVGLYTSGGDTLHFCYTFDLFGAEFSGDHFRKTVSKFEESAADGWVCWAFSNHDVVRHITRFTKPGDNALVIARLAILILVALRGTICLYQGEELALTEADIAFEDLRDPYGIRFWPAFKGRDGCRTPMPWGATEFQAGFTTAKPWLPIPDMHRAIAVDTQDGNHDSMLSHYRRAIRFRHRNPELMRGDLSFPDAPDDLLVIVRSFKAHKMLCVFNLSRRSTRWKIPADLPAFVREPTSSSFAGLDETDVLVPPLGYLFARS
jgi:alpha-glucosidase